MMTHCQTAGRKVHLVNLDPAAEHFEYEPTIGKSKTCEAVTAEIAGTKIVCTCRYQRVDYLGGCHGRIGLRTKRWFDLLFRVSTEDVTKKSRDLY